MPLNKLERFLAGTLILSTYGGIGLYGFGLSQTSEAPLLEILKNPYVQGGLATLTGVIVTLGVWAFQYQNTHKG